LVESARGNQTAGRFSCSAASPCRMMPRLTIERNWKASSVKKTGGLGSTRPLTKKPTPIMTGSTIPARSGSALPRGSGLLPRAKTPNTARKSIDRIGP